MSKWNYRSHQKATNQVKYFMPAYDATVFRSGLAYKPRLISSSRAHTGFDRTRKPTFTTQLCYLPYLETISPFSSIKSATTWVSVQSVNLSNSALEASALSQHDEQFPDPTCFVHSHLSRHRLVEAF